MTQETVTNEITIPNPVTIVNDPKGSRSIGASRNSYDIRRRYISDRNYVERGLIAIRWATVLVGLVFTIIRASDGEIRLVGTLAIMVFMTTYRTFYPISLGNRNNIGLYFGLADVVIFAAAIGIREGFSNPFVGCVFAAIAVVAFGWGFVRGLIAGGLAIAVTSFVLFFSETIDSATYLRQLIEISGFIVVIAVIPAFALKRILEAEGVGAQLKFQRDSLVETNQLLEVLNELARTLPSSLDLTDAIEATKDQLSETFNADRVAVLVYEDETWAPLIQQGFNIPPKVGPRDLPELLLEASQSVGVTIQSDLSKRTQRFGSGMYVRLIANNQDTGLIAIEHNKPNYFTETDRDLLVGMSDVLALTLANARSFNKLRSLAADEERTRIARDLHDRLGQYLTYISLEIERIKDDPKRRNESLSELHEEVQRAITEFRDTLLELRVAVSKDRPLNEVLKEVTERFEKRSKIRVDLQTAANGRRLPAPIENELLRITQEALTNIEKHADASEVHIRWSITDNIGVMLVNDNGRGFDPSKGIRGSAYGLVGMRERAAAIGAHIEITSEPGHGTNIIVQTRLPSG